MPILIAKTVQSNWMLLENTRNRMAHPRITLMFRIPVPTHHIDGNIYIFILIIIILIVSFFVLGKYNA